MSNVSASDVMSASYWRFMFFNMLAFLILIFLFLTAKTSSYFMKINREIKQVVKNIIVLEFQKKTKQNNLKKSNYRTQFCNCTLMRELTEIAGLNHTSKTLTCIVILSPGPVSIVRHEMSVVRMNPCAQSVSWIQADALV